MFTTRPEIAGTFGVVGTTHWLASAAAMAVLERGGNAFDAAAAAGFVLNVAEPHLNGPGGDAPIIVHDAREQRQHVICGQGVAPSAAKIAHFEQLGLHLVPGTGMLPAVVPGAFDAWATMLRNWGSWELADVLEYALGYAVGGVHLVPRVLGTITGVKPLLEQEWPSSAAVFLPGGNVPEAGRLFRRPALAAFWRRLLKEAVGSTREARIDAARNAFYRGFAAEAIGRFYAQNELLDCSGRHHRGLLAADDLARWSAPVEEPLAYDYHGHTVLKCGPWSQGPAMLQQLALLAGFDIAAMDAVGADFVHAVIECAKLAFADREAYYGDPDFVPVPLGHLLSKGYNDERRELVGARASLELRPGEVPGFTPIVDRHAEDRLKLLTGDLAAGEPTVMRMGVTGADTCHVDVIDRWGNMVSATPSGGWLQSSPVIPELGFPLSTRGQMFWLQPGLPASLAPRKRPRSTLSPSLVLRDGKAWMAFGTPGGDQQDQWQPIMLLRMIHHGMNIQQAIELPSFHSEHFPSSFWPRVARPGRLVIEGQYSDAVLADLLARGHKAEKGPEWSEGRLSGARLEADGQMFAGANPRGMQGYAVGR
jgi:gamma-glutamyltranspeptidase / glutathione hydrolase